MKFTRRIQPVFVITLCREDMSTVTEQVDDDYQEATRARVIERWRDAREGRQGYPFAWVERVDPECREPDQLVAGALDYARALRRYGDRLSDGATRAIRAMRAAEGVDAEACAVALLELSDTLGTPVPAGRCMGPVRDAINRLGAVVPVDTGNGARLADAAIRDYAARRHAEGHRDGPDHRRATLSTLCRWIESLPPGRPA